MHPPKTHKYMSKHITKYENLMRPTYFILVNVPDKYFVLH